MRMFEKRRAVDSGGLLYLLGASKRVAVEMGLDQT
jgi:hypothetical protein